MFFKSLALVLASLSAAYATISVTSPTASTTFTAGQQATITWIEGGGSPTLQQLGACKISIYAGSQLQQTSLQVLSPSTDVSQTSSLTFTPDASIGPNSSEYFIRFESVGLVDPNQPTIGLAFSAKFTLAGMTGVFSADVQAQINAGNSAAAAGQTTGGSASTPTGAAQGGPGGGGVVVTPKSTTSTVTVKSSSTSSGAPKSTNTGAAVDSRAGWAGVVIAAVVGASMF